MTRQNRGRGSAAIEMAILMPVFVALFTTVVVIGRTANATSAVEAAAYNAARTASLTRDAVTAEAEARAAVNQTLASQGVACVGGPEVIVDPSGFGVALGQPASVTVTVTCRVTYADVDLLAVPDDLPVSATFVSPIDQYRSRS
jgi:Flp pilus assembly protein TadG